MRTVIEQLLPFMRRFARAIAGTQEAGDAAVREALAEILQHPVPREEARLALYRALVRSLQQAERVEHPDEPIADGAIIARRVGQLALARRVVLLLSVLESFSIDDIASTMERSPHEVEQLLAEAKEHLREQRPTRILIIEDEPIIALDIAQLVQRNGHEVVGIAATLEEAVAMASRHSPGLVLADIQLADDSSGIDAVRLITDGHSIPAIFITAFPERLLTGDRPEPTFLISKPFDADTLNVSISQALATSEIR